MAGAFENKQAYVICVYQGAKVRQNQAFYPEKRFSNFGYQADETHKK